MALTPDTPMISEVELDPTRIPNWPLLSVYGASEFMDRTAPEFQWLVPGLIPLAVPTVLAAKGGLGKSYLALQLCIALATGKSFLDFPERAPVAAVYFGLEDSKDTFHHRFQAIIRRYQEHRDWTEDDDVNLRKHFAAPFINWQAPKATTFLPDLLPSLEIVIDTNGSRGVPPGLMVIDTLARVSEGDENTVQALRPVLNACSKIAHLGYTPLVLHHVGKGQDGAKNAQSKPTLADRMSTEWVRGSSAIVDNFRCVLQFAGLREDEADGAGLDTDRARMGQYLIFGATKANGGQRQDWKFLEQADHGGWFVPHGAIETLAKLRGRKALTALKGLDEILISIHRITRLGIEPDRKALAEQHCKEAKDKVAAFRMAVHKLRKAGFIGPSGLILTPQGFNRVQETMSETLPSSGDGDV